MEWSHMGKKITVDGRGQFYVEGDRGYPTLEEAKQAAEEEAKLVSLDLPVLFDTGQEGVITRVHRGTGQFIVKGWGNELSDMYYPCDVTRRLVQELEEARASLKSIKDRLAPYEVSLPRGHSWGRKAPGEAYEMQEEMRERYRKLEEVARGQGEEGKSAP